LRNERQIENQLKIALVYLLVEMLEYSIELLIEYLSTRLIPEVTINYRVVQKKWIPDSSFKFIAQQRFDTSQNMSEMLQKSL